MESMHVDNALFYAMRNKPQLAAAVKAGCYQCLKIFEPGEIKEYTDQEDTALCPYCSEDAVIPEKNNVEITEEYLQAVKDFWVGT